MILKLFRKLKKIFNKLIIGKKVNHQLPQINGKYYDNYFRIKLETDRNNTYIDT